MMHHPFADNFSLGQLARSRRWLVTCIVLAVNAKGLCAAELSPLEQLGKQIFFDKNLSSPAGQSCASCHAPEVGFTGPDSNTNLQTAVYQGAAPGRFGNRKPPSAAYASFSPKREYNAKDETWVGGQFWDGRADDLVEQAKGPFLNPLEMNNASAADVVDKVKHATYRGLFAKVYGPKALTESGDEEAFDLIARAIAAYEASREVNAFSSKYDAFLAGQAKLTAAEQRGLNLFANKAGCTACHPHQKGDDGSPPLFTDFSYDNVGTPRNPGNPFYRASSSVNADGAKYRDTGLGSVLKDDTQLGKVKVPTLRNVAKRPHPQFVKAYLHNGVFKSLKDVVAFYNRRDKNPEQFGAPDVIENINREELGKLGLTDAEENDIVAFLETLSDGYVANRPSQSEPEFPATAPPVTSQDHFRGARDVIRVVRFRTDMNPSNQPGRPPR
jgi:cytochrome c peroxidase